MYWNWSFPARSSDGDFRPKVDVQDFGLSVRKVLKPFIQIQVAIGRHLLSSVRK
jgi:hypothetical protein